jgi:predicted transport protein
LTLTGYNSEYSDLPFKKKRDMEGGFKDSPLRVNEGLGQLEDWNEGEIKKRAQRLAWQCRDVWKPPTISEDRLAVYRTKESQPSSYTINDHPFLLQLELGGVFEAFRKEILSLDPCVTEVFLSLYVAYKAETNFVDVIPQAKRLILSLNLPFSELNDPRHKCKDVTDLGHWGNGNVEAYLSSKEEIPYVLSLVRQAFERQMENGDHK